MTQPLRSTRVTGLHHDYELLRPCVPHRYSDSHGVSHLNVSLYIGTTGSHVPQRSQEQLHATFTPDTTQPVSRLPLDSSQTTIQNPVLMSPNDLFDASAVVRFRSSRCSTHDVLTDAFSLTLTTATLDRSSSGWFEASLCRAAPEGLPPSPLELRHFNKLLCCFVPRGTRIARSSTRRWPAFERSLGPNCTPAWNAASGRSVTMLAATSPIAVRTPLAVPNPIALHSVHDQSQRRILPVER